MKDLPGETSLMPCAEDYSTGVRVRLLVRGIVQGVGFRPYIFTLATRFVLKGQVFNTSVGVLIDVEGAHDSIERFIKEINSNPPPLSTIESIERDDDAAFAGYTDFRIIESRSDETHLTSISPDIATCDDCLREVFDARNRRHRYPFINCTNCGLRITIIENIPYDRANTTMRDFQMCEACRAEYEDPRDRRFHAEPIACDGCGARIYLIVTDRQKPDREGGRAVSVKDVAAGSPC